MICFLTDPQQWVQDAMGEGPNPRQILLPLLGPDCPQVSVHVLVTVISGCTMYMYSCIHVHVCMHIQCTCIHKCTCVHDCKYNVHVPLMVPTSLSHIQLPDMDDVTLWRLVVSLLMTPEPRNKLPQYNTLDDVVQLISGASNIMVLTGAGVSVPELSSGACGYIVMCMYTNVDICVVRYP